MNFIPITSNEDCIYCAGTMRNADTLGHVHNQAAHVFHRACLKDHAGIVSKEKKEKSEAIDGVRRNLLANLPQAPEVVHLVRRYVSTIDEADKVAEFTCPICRELINEYSLLTDKEKIITELRLIKADVCKGAIAGAGFGFFGASIFGSTFFSVMDKAIIRSEINRITGHKAFFFVKALTGVTLGVKNGLPYALSAGALPAIYVVLTKKDLAKHAFLSILIASLIAGGMGMIYGSQGIVLATKAILPKISSRVLTANLLLISQGIGTVASGAISGAISGGIFGGVLGLADRCIKRISR